MVGRGWRDRMEKERWNVIDDNDGEGEGREWVQYDDRAAREGALYVLYVPLFG